jgi:hypothetical protein
MPAAIPVIIAVVADVAVGAGIIGGTLTGLTAAFAVIGAAGATLSAIGSVTHNKGLTLAGGIIGAIGAVGSLASGAGLLDGLNSTLFGPAPTDLAATNAGASGLTAEIGGDTSPALTDTLGGASADSADLIGIPPAPPGNVGAVDPMTGNVITEAQAPASAAGPAAAEAATTPGEVAQTGTPNPNAVDTSGLSAEQQASVAASAPPTSTAPTTPDATAATPKPPAAPQTTQAAASSPVEFEGQVGRTVNGQELLDADQTVGAPTPPQPPTAWDKVKDAGSSVADFAKNNQLITWAALQSGGNLISGMFSSLTPAQAAAANAQAAANNAAADLANQQRQNLAGAKTVAEATPVTGAPAPITATGGSFINGAMPPGIMPPPQPQLAPVTGRVT